MNNKKNKLFTLVVQIKNRVLRNKHNKTIKKIDPEYCDVCECTPCDCGFGSY